jgi:CRISPR-associated protein Cmr2
MFNPMNDTVWQTKLAARIHDPIEKALVLLRDPAGHENGTSRSLLRLLGLGKAMAETIDPDNAEVLNSLLFKKGLPIELYRHIQRADWWAAAADRPQFPYEEISVKSKNGQEQSIRIAPWAQVRWSKEPILIHPLTGDQLNLKERGDLTDTEFVAIKQKSFDHFSRLLVALHNQGDEQDWRKLLLTWWRFGAEMDEEEDNGRLGELWRLLPADTRVPDHSIWDHLDLTSAFAGAFAADPDNEVALLTLAIGPVQPFIAAARSTSDLWAGSHLLARLSWEAMRVVCEALGPDAILFPRLRGIPQVDLWLRDEMKLPRALFANCDWNRGRSDANPLFSAALPNRFVAVVPASQAKALAQEVEQTVRRWLADLGRDVVHLLLEESGYDGAQEYPCYAQMADQLNGFPEVHWAAVPFSSIKVGDKARQRDLDTLELSSTMAPFFGVAAGTPCGFLATPAWRLLAKDIELQHDGKRFTFFSPNPGVLYPAVFDLAERVLAAAKAVRPFVQTEQHGWRCSLTGETEWLTTDRAQLAIPAGSRKESDTLWNRIASRKPSWAKKGEHLGALSAIKRLWPTLFTHEVDRALDGDKLNIKRFVVSTHTMALAHQLDRWLEKGAISEGALADNLQRYECEAVALPRKLLQRHAGHNGLQDARFLPDLLDKARDCESEDQSRIERQLKAMLDCPRIETYYGLLMLDGDNMGAWLSGGEEKSISYRDSFHPHLQQGFDAIAAKQPVIRQYGAQKRALAPNRHLAISGALNDFSLTVVRHVVEDEYLGRLIYAGGDDVLAMSPVVDLLPMMQRLRYAYSGHDPEHAGGTDVGLSLHNGFALLKQGSGDRQRVKLMRMMGSRATASCGAVIAHHQAPLSAVMRELRAAESRAKISGGRDAFSLTIIKRSGGALQLTEKWGKPVRLLADLRQFLASDGVSRRAIYHTLQWLDGNTLPPITHGDQLRTLLTYQLDRQTNDKMAAAAKAMVPGLGKDLTELTLSWQVPERIKRLRNFLSVAEFLARETRIGGAE